MSEHDLQLSIFPANAGSDEDQDPQCWKDVKAETGFSSYQSFLKALNETGPHFSGLLEDPRDDGPLMSCSYVLTGIIRVNGRVRVRWLRCLPKS